MDDAEFRRLARLGLGRAILYLRANDPAPYRDAIIDAAIHRQGYDRQAEGSRLQYVLELIACSDAPDDIREAVIDAIATAQDDYDGAQLFELGVVHAREGHARARDAMYLAMRSLIDHWIANGFETTHYRNGQTVRIMPSMSLPEILIALDGINAVVFVVEQLGRLVQAPLDWDDDDWLLRALEPEWDVERVRAELDRAASDNSFVASYLAMLDAQNGDDQKTYRDSRHTVRALENEPYDAVRAWIEAHPSSAVQGRWSWRKWARNANEPDLRRAAADLSATPDDDIDRLDAYLWMFTDRPFPLDPTPLIRLLNHPHERIPWFAANALEHVTHPDVRRLGFSLMESSHPLRGRAVDMLVSNYRVEDAAAIEEFLRRDLDEDEIHTVGFSLLTLHERYSARELVPSIMHMYERNPCSHCREQFVEILLELDALPDWMRQECLWDANLHIRALVARPDEVESSS